MHLKYFIHFNWWGCLNQHILYTFVFTIFEPLWTLLLIQTVVLIKNKRSPIFINYIWLRGCEKCLFILSDALTQANLKGSLIVVVNKLVYLFILHRSNSFDVMSFHVDKLQIFLESKHALLHRYVASFHMISFFNEVNEALRLNKSMSKLFVVTNACISVKIKDLMCSGLL